MVDHIITPGSVTILMVDDNLTNIRLLADMLTSRGYKILQAINGPDALTIAREQSPDLILLDIFMPKMDGYEVCKRLKEDAATCDIPVIFISALTDVDDIVKGFDVGGADYITKPFKFKEVLVRVASQLTLVRQRQELEAKREQDRKHFEKLDRMKNEFLQMATHDLRNPLNVILGYLRVLEQLEVADDDRARLDETRSSIRTSVEKMRTLVADILELAQIETGLKLSPQPITVAEWLDQTLQSFKVMAEEKHVTLDYTPPPAKLTITGDVKLLTRVIDNLVSNALKYTPQGGTVCINTTVSERTIVISVTDTGLGIPAHDLPHLFDAFYRVDRRGQQQPEGSGLGLSIVKTIVQHHHGTIDVESTVGEGSTFRITLPLAATTAEKTGDGA